MSKPKNPNQALRYHRELRNWTQEQAAEALLNEFGPGQRGEVSAKTISNWERGVQIPSFEYREKLCRLYGVSSPEELGFLKREDVVDMSVVSQKSSTFDRKPSEQEVGTQVATFASFDSPSSQQYTNSPHILSSALPFSLAKAQKSIFVLAENTPEMAELYSEHHAGDALTFGAYELASLFDAGWSLEIVLETLRVLLPLVQAVPPSVRHRQLVTGLTMLGNISSFAEKKHMTDEEQAHLCQAFHDGISMGWKLFTMGKSLQALAVSQAQLKLLQQVHALLPVHEVPFLYSSIYNLVGMAFCHQERYREALKAHTSAYIAALSSGNTLDVTYGLLCQANSYYTLSQYSTAINMVEQALRTFEALDHQQYMHTKAHALGIWADSAMMAGDYESARKKLDAIATLLDDVGPNEEFDKSSWYQLSGKYAYITGDFAAAARWYEQALCELPAEWTIRRALVLAPLISTYTVIQDRDASILTVEKAAPVIRVLNSSNMNKPFTQALQGLQIVFPHEIGVTTIVSDLLQQTH